MFKTLLNDRGTIEIKYHYPENFDPYNRMQHHGYDYDHTTGLPDEEMDAKLSDLASELEGEPHPIIKAKLFECVLDNTRIDVNEHDYFVGFWSWGRVISKYTVFKWLDEIKAEVPGEIETMRKLDRAGFCYGWLDLDHTVPDWDYIMERGFPGILEDLHLSWAKLSEKCEPSAKQTALYNACVRSFEAIIRLLDRLYNYALTNNFDKAPIIADSLKRLRDGAPVTSYDCLQMIYIYFMLSESVDHFQVRSLGHGLDATLYPYYVSDIENGRFNKEEIGELIGYFLMQWSAIGNYWGQPLYLGGADANGECKVNELTYLILDVYDKLGLYNPKIQIRVSKNTPRKLKEKTLDMIRNGINSIVFVNQQIVTKCLMANGYTYEESADPVISGCYEYLPRAKEIDISVSYLNPLTPVNLVFSQGFDNTTGCQIGLLTKDISEIKSFSEFYEIYLAQLDYLVGMWTSAMNEYEKYTGDLNPSMLLSAVTRSCRESMTDPLDSGMNNSSWYTVSGIGTAVDALMAVNELVFVNKAVTLEEYKAALDADYVGYERLRAMALGCKHKYGNGDEMSDYYANAIVKFISDKLNSEKNGHGGRRNLSIHSARAFIIQGQKTGASPDGRRRGDEISKNASPTPGADRNGITALIKSATTIDPTTATLSNCLDAMLHPSAVQGDDGLTALRAVLDTYIDRGGQSIHFNIFSTELLKDAQEHPEKYRNLQVRVCGWNQLWNNMPRPEQDAYIRRAEGIM